MNQDKPLVSICCITYNHEDYIRDAIESFLMQEVNFPIEIIIHDDASTDRTAKIIKEYHAKKPDLISPILQKVNQWSKDGGSIFARFVFPQAQGKYIALCEGDDYWTDPLKLQKQIHFMETNPNFTLTCGGYKSINVYTGQQKINNYCTLRDINQGFVFGLEDMDQTWLTKTLTTVLRKDSLVEFQKKEYKHTRDIHLFYHAIKAGNGYYFNDIFGVYSIHKGGISSMESSLIKSFQSYDCYKELYQINKDSFTKHRLLIKTVLLFNRNLYSNSRKIGITKNIKLLFKAIKLIEKPIDCIWLLRAFVPSVVLDKIPIKNLFN